MSKFACPQCGKQSRLPDFCCGKSMAAKGSFACPGCGKSARSAQECCGKDMIQV
ncbi:MAG: hypothetical protein KGZ96_10185 [Clostridia bacterium]|nr:hypothetical protein [Clostridia bacterium]